MIINDEIKNEIINRYNNGENIKSISINLNIKKYLVNKILNFSGTDRIKICPICNKEFTTKYNKIVCSNECRSKYRKIYMKKLNYCYDKVKDWRLKNKKLAINYKGGKCIVCDYDKCMSALEFHHLNPNEKDFNISKNKNMNFDTMKIELQKCVLVCCNCHREIHTNLVDINIYLYKNVNDETCVKRKT